jgi:hypothetical protein
VRGDAAEDQYLAIGAASAYAVGLKHLRAGHHIAASGQQKLGNLLGADTIGIALYDGDDAQMGFYMLFYSVKAAGNYAHINFQIRIIKA